MNPIRMGGVVPFPLVSPNGLKTLQNIVTYLISILPIQKSIFLVFHRDFWNGVEPPLPPKIRLTLLLRRGGVYHLPHHKIPITPITRTTNAVRNA